MGEYGGGGSYDSLGDEEVKHVVEEEEEDWSWMQSSRTRDDVVNAAEGGEAWEYSYNHHQQVARDGASSESSEEAVPKTRKKLGARRSYKHLQESHLDAHSDPGYGGGNNRETAGLVSSHSLNRVSSWLHDASFEDPQQFAPGQPSGPPRRRPPPSAELLHSSSLPNPNDIHHYNHYEYDDSSSGYGYPYTSEAHYEDTQLAIRHYDLNQTPDASEYPYTVPEAHYEDTQLAIRHYYYYNQPSLAMDSVYNYQSEKPLGKAIDFMKKASIGVAKASHKASIGVAKVSHKASVELAKASVKASKVVMEKSIEWKNVAVPVLEPIVKAVIAEGAYQLTGPQDTRRDLLYQRPLPNQAELQRMATPYVPSIGRGRAAPHFRPMVRSGMQGGPRPMHQQQPMARPSSMVGGRAGGRPLGPGIPSMGVSSRGQGVPMRGHPRGPPRPVLLAQHSGGPTPRGTHLT